MTSGWLDLIPLTYYLIIILRWMKRLSQVASHIYLFSTTFAKAAMEASHLDPCRVGAG
jgi:hypothetical protein